MPIVDIDMVGGEMQKPPAQAVADALGAVFGSTPGRTWVRWHALPADSYAENGVALAAEALPVFVTILHAHPPAGDALAAQLAAVTQAVARCVKRPPERVHVQYAPAAAGRQAFGGTLVE